MNQLTVIQPKSCDENKPKCSALREDGGCALINHPRRPKVCADAYNKQKDGVMFMPHCIYEPAKSSIVLTEEGLK